MTDNTLVTRYRIMVGIGADGDGRAISPERGLEVVKAIATAKLRAYSITQGAGYWEGMAEPSLVIEHLSDRPDAACLVREVAIHLRSVLDQAEVWYTEEPVLLRIVSGR